ncbi:MAG: YitT family protein, partial [Erysipelotrichia bacterium]|nr:YitT family protein [Erysipelotrichia bacterium]
PPMLPDLSAYPLIAAILGGIFVGVGVGIIIRQGGSAGGDDALALVISHLLHWPISRSYLFTDVTVLLLSLTYIPFKRIIFSLITVNISSYLIDWIKEYKKSSIC